MRITKFANKYGPGYDKRALQLYIKSKLLECEGFNNGFIGFVNSLVADLFGNDYINDYETKTLIQQQVYIVERGLEKAGILVGINGPTHYIVSTPYEAECRIEQSGKRAIRATMRASHKAEIGQEQWGLLDTNPVIALAKALAIPYDEARKLEKEANNYLKEQETLLIESKEENNQE